MKISLFKTECIIDRIKEKYNSEIYNNNVVITEFDDPIVKIENEFKEWFDAFSKKEKLIVIMFDLLYKINQVKVKHNIDKIEIELERIKYFKSLFSKLRSSGVSLGKNEILGKLNKMENTEHNVFMETSIFSKSDNNRFLEYLNKLSLEEQAFLEEINNKKTKPYVILDDDTVEILENELLL